ncbi:MAG TPA: hypothetical protein VIJ12_08345 [Candidatus Baltobacteraceae bacterium]
MTIPKRVLTIGFDPTLVDFTNIPGLDAAKVSAAIKAEMQRLIDLGYAPHACMIDLGETAEAVVSEQLAKTKFDCVLIGAGVRNIPAHFLLFERLINIVHSQAPDAKICFNTNPGDTVEAIQRWI